MSQRYNGNQRSTETSENQFFGMTQPCERQRNAGRSQADILSKLRRKEVDAKRETSVLISLYSLARPRKAERAADE